MEALSAAMQALFGFAYPGTTLDQAGCHRDSQLHKQASAVTPKRSFFFCLQRKGMFGTFEQAQQNHSPFLKERLGCPGYKTETKPSAEAICFPAVFQRDRAPMRCPLIQPGVNFLWTRESIKFLCGSWL